MKTLKLDILFNNNKQIKKDIPISNEMYEHLMTPYKRWGDDMEKYMGKNEDKFYDAIYTVQTILLEGILEHYFGLSIDEWTISDQDYNSSSISFSIDVDDID